METLLLDVRYALRQIRRRPVFTVVAALSLAIGVGANTAIFSAVSAVLLRPVGGVAEPDRVVELGRTTQGRGFDTFAYPDFVDIREGVEAFEAAAAYTLEIFAFSRGDEGERITGQHVSWQYFDVMGVEPGQGRFFTAEEEAPGAAGDVVVLSHDFWADRLAGDPGVIGTTVRVNRMPFTVIGITPEAFRGHMIGFRPDVYVPLRSSPLLRERESVWTARNSLWHQALARLAPDATLELARTQVRAVTERLAAEYESNRRRDADVVALGLVPGAARGGVTGFLAILMGMVILILLVTCANVAGMFLARGTAREKEIAVRLAIGSGRTRLIRQLVTEALVVFAIGGAVGGFVGVRLVEAVPLDALPFPIPVHADLSADAGVLLFGLAVTLVTGIVFGLLPALKLTRLDLVPSLKDEGGRTGRMGRLRKVFVGGQVGLSLVLLVAAGLLARSLQRAAGVETGFDPTNTYMTGIDLSLEGYEDDEGGVFQRRALESVRSTPGVESAALAIDLPLDLGSHGTSVLPEGWDEGDGRLPVDFNHVTPKYFQTLRIPVIEGRDFTVRDVEGAEPVIVVSRTFAETVWPGESAVGRSVRMGGGESATPRTVIGVVDDVVNQVVTEASKPFIYLPLWQAYRPSTSVVVRVSDGMDAVGPALRGAILDMDPSLSLSPVIALERYTSIGILPQRIAASVTTILGLFALLLAGLGVYGVVAFAVQQRSREIGIRMALGAGGGRILRQVLVSGLLLALPGLAVGAVVAVGIGHAMRFLLLGLSPMDPVALAAVALLMTAVVALASFVPARRATTVEPVRALRSE